MSCAFSPDSVVSTVLSRPASAAPVRRPVPRPCPRARSYPVSMRIAYYSFIYVCMRIYDILKYMTDVIVTKPVVVRSTASPSRYDLGYDTYEHRMASCIVSRRDPAISGMSCVDRPDLSRSRAPALDPLTSGVHMHISPWALGACIKPHSALRPEQTKNSPCQCRLSTRRDPRAQPRCQRHTLIASPKVGARQRNVGSHKRRGER